ncbi:MAG TPA: J domain-containing protein [Patescibacteria group bacterium]|nr:J domain-containing protein [Patescibacteria group bacterium]
MTSPPDPYKVLQVDPEAEDEVIQAAYRRLAQKYHPDVAGPDGAERMTAINAAWALLRDPAQRASLDRERRVGRERPGPAGASRPGGGASAGRSPEAPPPAAPPPPPPSDGFSPDWTSGRSSHGSGYDQSRMRAPEGLGAAGPPPGNPVGSVLNFGRFAGWSLGEIGRRDVEYLEWLDRMTIGRPYRDEIDTILRRVGRRKSAVEARDRPGLDRRR